MGMLPRRRCTMSWFVTFAALLAAFSVLPMSAQAHYDHDDDDDDDDDDDPDYEQYYMEDVCNKTVEVGSGDTTTYGYLQVSRSGKYSAFMDCSYRLQVQPNRYLTMHIARIDTECGDGSLNISGATNWKSYCGRTSGISLSSSSNYLNVHFITGDYALNHDVGPGFVLYYTMFHADGNCDIGNDEFRCRYDDRCIDDDVVCDGRNNCGNWADESMSVCGLSTGAIVAIVICSVLAGLTLVFAVGYCVCVYAAARKNKIRSPRPTAQNPTGGDSLAVHYTVDPTVPQPPPPYAYVNSSMAYPASDLGNASAVTGDFPSPPLYDEISSSDQSKTIN